ncbi:MAG: hypothetical protein H7841_09570 [Magnetospirillum sp. WYHS-4]
MAEHSGRRLVVEARHGATWVTITVLSPERAERAASIAVGALGNPAFDIVQICLDTEDEQGGVVRREIFRCQRRRPKAERFSAPSLPRRLIVSSGRVAALAMAAMVSWLVLPTSLPQKQDSPAARAASVTNGTVTMALPLARDEGTGRGNADRHR